MPAMLGSQAGRLGHSVPSEGRLNTPRRKERAMPRNKHKWFAFSRMPNQDFSVALRFTFALSLAILILAAPSAAQTVTDIYNFTGNAGDGSEPGVPMIVGANGVLYGTTVSGGDLSCGVGGCGTVFQVTPSDGQWTHSTIYEFQGGRDGVDSYSVLTLDRAGRLYGVTNSGTPYGAIYRLTPGAPGEIRHFHLLYEFKGQSDGAYSLSPLFLDNSGAIYGASLQGGLHGKGCNQQFGCGAVFQLVPPAGPGDVWTENTLYDFRGLADGRNPSTMIMDSTGTIYGTTTSGGTFNQNCPSGCGVVFKLARQNGFWKYSVIHRFKGTPNQIPYGNLVLGPKGVLYGLVRRGFEGSGGGDIFELTPPVGQTRCWTLQTIHRYPTNTYPATNLTLAANGVLYGDIYGDQDFDWGYVFQLVPPAQPEENWTYTTLVDFNRLGFSQNPDGVVLASGTLYVTMSGGTYWPGAIVSVVP